MRWMLSVTYLLMWVCRWYQWIKPQVFVCFFRVTTFIIGPSIHQNWIPSLCEIKLHVDLLGGREQYSETFASWSSLPAKRFCALYHSKRAHRFATFALRSSSAGTDISRKIGWKWSSIVLPVEQWSTWVIGWCYESLCQRGDEAVFLLKFQSIFNRWTASQAAWEGKFRAARPDVGQPQLNNWKQLAQHRWGHNWQLNHISDWYLLSSLSDVLYRIYVGNRWHVVQQDVWGNSP